MSKYTERRTTHALAVDRKELVKGLNTANWSITKKYIKKGKGIIPF